MNCEDEKAQLIRDYYQNKVNKEEIIKNQESNTIKNLLKQEPLHTQK